MIGINMRVVCLLLAFITMLCMGTVLAASDVAASPIDQMSRIIYLKRRLLPGVAGTKYQSVELPTTDAERLVWCNNLRQQYSMTQDKNTLGMCHARYCYGYIRIYVSIHVHALLHMRVGCSHEPSKRLLYVCEERYCRLHPLTQPLSLYLALSPSRSMSL